MSSLLPFIITGLVTGSLYGLAGVGLVLAFRTSGVFNFGHGAVAAAAAFMFYSLHFESGMAWPIAGLLTVGLFGTVGGVVLAWITRGLVGASEALVVVGTVALMLGIQGLIFLRYGLVTRGFPDFLPTSGFTISGVAISWAQLISFVVAAGGAIGLYLFLQRARLGVAMRAVVDNPTLASLSGERPDRIRLAGWCIAAASAAVSGILLAPTLNLDATLLTLLVVQAFGACAVGRFKSLPLTFVGGLIIGVAASVMTRYLPNAPWSGLATTAPFLVLIVVLLVTPAAKLPSLDAPRRSLASLSTVSMRTRVVSTGAGAAVLLVLPAIVGTKLPVWTTGIAYTVVFGSLGLLVWASGQLSLCHAAFLAFGATTMAHLTGAGVPWLLSLMLAGAFTMPLGALVAIPAIRMSGIYLGLVTLGFAILMQNVVYPTSLMFGTQLTVTVPRPQLGPIDGRNDTTLYYLILAIAVVCGAMLLAAWRGRFGRLLQALSEAPTMLATEGLTVPLTRLIVFCVAAFFAGIGGALVIAQTGAASGVTFGPITSLLLLSVLAICGTRRLLSPALAAAVLTILPSYFTDFGFERQLLAFGVAGLGAATIIANRESLRLWMSAAAGRADRRHQWVARRPPLRKTVSHQPGESSASEAAAT